MIAAASPDVEPQRQRELVRVYIKLGEIEVLAGELDQARDWFAKALAIAEPDELLELQDKLEEVDEIEQSADEDEIDHNVPPTQLRRL